MPSGRRSPLAFGMYVRRTAGRSPIAAGLCAFEQPSEVALEIGRVFVRALSVDAPCPVLARTPMRLAHPVDVDVMSQRRQRRVCKLLRQVRYLLESR